MVVGFFFPFFVLFYVKALALSILSDEYSTIIVVLKHNGKSIEGYREHLADHC